MRGFFVRPATVDDIPALCALETECFTTPWSERSFCEFFAQSNALAYAAVLDGRVVGYAGLYLSYGDGDVTNVAVTAEFRRLGIGSALIAALAGSEGVERLLLEVRESNHGARALYEGLGFKVDGRRRGFYQSPREDAILMSLNKTETGLEIKP